MFEREYERTKERKKEGEGGGRLFERHAAKAALL